MNRFLWPGVLNFFLEFEIIELVLFSDYISSQRRRLITKCVIVSSRLVKIYPHCNYISEIGFNHEITDSVCIVDILHFEKKHLVLSLIL